MRKFLYTVDSWVSSFLSYLEKYFTFPFVLFVFGKQKPHLNRNGSDMVSIHDSEHNNVSISMFGVCVILLFKSTIT